MVGAVKARSRFLQYLECSKVSLDILQTDLHKSAYKKTLGQTLALLIFKP